MRADVDAILGVVLAGGAGTRVGGADKGLLALSGRPLIEHVLERLRPQCGRALITANRNVEVYAGYAATVRDESGAHAGPLAGLVAAFGFLAANPHALPCWMLTVPVDCPDPPRDLAVRLHAALPDGAFPACAFASVGGAAQPLFALYRIDASAEAWQAAAQQALVEHGSPWRWHAAIGAIAADFEAAGDVFHNLNTPADFREYERTHAGT